MDGSAPWIYSPCERIKELRVLIPLQYHMIVHISKRDRENGR